MRFNNVKLFDIERKWYNANEDHDSMFDIKIGV